ncbi:MAG: hypothetical protein WBN40_05130, partial [Pseudomonadales bacterium]
STALRIASAILVRFDLADLSCTAAKANFTSSFTWLALDIAPHRNWPGNFAVCTHRGRMRGTPPSTHHCCSLDQASAVGKARIIGQRCQQHQTPRVGVFTPHRASCASNYAPQHQGGKRDQGVPLCFYVQVARRFNAPENIRGAASIDKKARGSIVGAWTGGRFFYGAEPAADLPDNCFSYIICGETENPANIARTVDVTAKVQCSRLKYNETVKVQRNRQSKGNEACPRLPAKKPC